MADTIKIKFLYFNYNKITKISLLADNLAPYLHYYIIKQNKNKINNNILTHNERR